MRAHRLTRTAKARAIKAHRRFTRLHPVVKYGLSLSIAELAGEAAAEALLHIVKELLTVAGVLIHAG